MKTVLFSEIFKRAKTRLEERDRYDIPPRIFSENQNIPE